MATLVRALTPNFLTGDRVLAKMKPKHFAEAAKKQRRRAEKVATRHYKNAAAEIKANLKHGFANPTAGGSRIIKSRDGEDKPVSYATEYWPKLNDDYRKRTIRSHRIWSKNRVLTKAVNRAIPRSSLKVKSKAIHLPKDTKQKKKGRRNFKMRYLLIFPRVNSEAFVALMTRPFVQADDSAVRGYSPHNIDRGSADIAWYPEMAKRLDRFKPSTSTKGKYRGPVNRPWIAGLSGQLGSRMHQAIRKL